MRCPNPRDVAVLRLYLFSNRCLLDIDRYAYYGLPEAKRRSSATSLHFLRLCLLDISVNELCVAPKPRDVAVLRLYIFLRLCLLIGQRWRRIY
jgi:hypothetical protein